MNYIEFGFPVPDKPWSTNQDRNMSPRLRHARIKSWKEAAYLGWVSYCAANNHPTALNPALIRVVIPFGQQRRRDPHNYCGSVVKAVIDGMVRAGAWGDDTPNFVEHLSPALRVTKDDVRVQIYVKRNAWIPCSHGIRCASPDCDGPMEVVWDV